MTALADTSFVLAMLNKADRNHSACLEVYASDANILMPQSVLTETAYMLSSRIGLRATTDFLDGLATSNFEVVALDPDDIKRTSQLLRTYADTRVDFVDASVAAVAERYGATQIFTLDRRDFGIIRPAHTDYFEILPAGA